MYVIDDFTILSMLDLSIISEASLEMMVMSDDDDATSSSKTSKYDENFHEPRKRNAQNTKQLYKRSLCVGIWFGDSVLNRSLHRLQRRNF